jgi:hypothetical protein
VLPAILAVGAIAAVVLLLIGIFGRTPNSGSAIPETTTSTTTTSTTTGPTTSTPAPTTTVPAVTTPTIPDTTVVVLNSTDTSQLAARVTAYLSDLGWQTADPSNFFPVLDETTVYYPEGGEAVALLLAAAVPGEADAVLPVIPEVGADVFTVVLGNDAVDWVAPTTAPTTSAAP